MRQNCYLIGRDGCCCYVLFAVIKTLTMAREMVVRSWVVVASHTA